MSDWDGPTPSDSGVSRRTLLAGLGGAAVLGGGAVAFGPDIIGGTAEQLATVSGVGKANSRVYIDGGVPLKATASAETPDTDNAGVVVEVISMSTEEIIIYAQDSDSVTARGTTDSSGLHWFEVNGAGEVEATLHRRSTRLF